DRKTAAASIVRLVRNGFAQRKLACAARAPAFSGSAPRLRLAQLASSASGANRRGGGRDPGTDSTCGWPDGSFLTPSHHPRSGTALLHHYHQTQLASAALRAIARFARLDAGETCLYLAGG